MPHNADILILTTDIGRGHPNYLDSLARSLREAGANDRVLRRSVFDNAGFVAPLLWRLIRRIYRLGSSGGLISRLYTALRSSQSEPDSASFLMRLLGRGIARSRAGFSGLIVCAHPLVARILVFQGCRTVYLHGEAAVPAEALVKGVRRLYVPLPESAERFAVAGISRDILFVSGLVLEPELLPDLHTQVQRRRERLTGSQPLSCLFCISGAYPFVHLRWMEKAARSCYEAGIRVFFSWGHERHRVMQMLKRIRRWAPEVRLLTREGGNPRGRILLIAGKTREDETLKSLEYVPEIDVFVAAPHERWNWAAGLGFPGVCLKPVLGTYAAENLAFIEKQGCGLVYDTGDSAREFPRWLQERRRELAAAADRGQRRDVQGAAAIAGDVLELAAAPH